MKKQFLVRWASLLTLIALAPLTSCEEDTDITSSLKYTIKLRVTGENLTDLGAEMRYTSLRNTLAASPAAGPTRTKTYTNSADSTYNVGEFGFYDRVEAIIALKSATCNATTHPRSSSFLRLEMLVNDRIVLREELNSASAQRVTCSPYWTITTTTDGDDWDE